MSPLIETISARCDLATADSPAELVRRYGSFNEQRLWRFSRGGGRVRRLRGVTVDLHPIPVGPRKGCVQAVIEFNATRLMYGERAKALTLPPADIGPAVARAIKAARATMPEWLPSVPEAWKVSRADANGTWCVPSVDAAGFFDALSAHLWATEGGRVSQPGRRSLRVALSKTEQLAIYDKTVESGWTPASGGHLVRVEHRVYGPKARSLYGESLADLTEGGPIVAYRRLNAAAEKLGAQIVSESVYVVFKELVRRGVEPAEAARMVGQVMLLARAGGTRGLIDEGFTPSQAYRVADKVARVLGKSEPGTQAGVLLDVGDVLYADQHFRRLTDDEHEAGLTESEAV